MASDITNPGLVNVADEVLVPPDPNGGTVEHEPEQLDDLTDVADQGYPPAPVSSESFPIPTDVEVDTLIRVPPANATFVPPLPTTNVADQVLVRGTPADFTVVGPTESFQTNLADSSLSGLVVAYCKDADTLAAPTANTTRYQVGIVSPPDLPAVPFTLLNRQLVFDDASLTPSVEGAARTIGGYGLNYVVVARIDNSDTNGNVPDLAGDPPAPPFGPQAGDTLTIYLNRQGPEQLATTGNPVAEVIINPAPVQQAPNPNQAILGGGTSYVSLGLPATPIIDSGDAAPPLKIDTVEVADECQVVGLPKNVFV